MSTKRLKPAIRKEEILAAALILATKHGYTNVARDEIAKQVGVGGSAVQYHFGTMAKLRTELMRYAVKQQNLRVIAQGLAVSDRQAAKASKGLKRQALAAML